MVVFRQIFAALGIASRQGCPQDVFTCPDGTTLVRVRKKL